MSDGWDYKDAERLAESWADEATEKAQEKIAELEEHAGRLQVRLNEAVKERDRFKERLQQSLDGTAELMEECRRLRFEPDRLRVQIGELEAGCEVCEEKLHEARQVARRYREGILRLDWYEWHEEMVLADEAAAAEKYPWLKE
jgi:chromosome segregation ATPase